MDSRSIYNISSFKKTKVKWLNPTYENGAWVYIGICNELNTELVFRTIHEYMPEDTIYVAYTRNGSMSLTQLTIEEALNGILGYHDFIIWDSNFKKVIEFNKNGVFRCGESD